MNDSLEQIINDVTDLSKKIVDVPPKTIDDLIKLAPKFREFSKRINKFGANDVSDNDVSDIMETWQKWMKRIETDIRTVLSHHRMLCEVEDMIIKNPDLPDRHVFYGCLGNMHLSYVLIGLRRQVDRDTRSISFMRLLEEIHETPEELSWEYYCSIQQGGYGKVTEDEFKKHANPWGTHICPEKVKADIEKLKSKSEPHVKFTNKRIAHVDKQGLEALDKQELKARLTYEELNACLGLLDKMYVKYQLLFFGEADNTLLPPLSGQWKEIFRKPWLV